MKTSFIFISFLFIALINSNPLDFSYYHTTQELNSKVEKLSNNCADASLQLRKINDNPSLSILEIRKSAHYAKHKGFILFGEHARELISPETGLKLIEGLCNADKNKKLNKEFQKSVLDHFDLNIVLNANPISRTKVEEGDMCLRTNENGVDINRNWDDHWSDRGNFETNPGDAPFSEIQTQLIRDELTAFKPDIFLSVHSGTLGLYTPHAYSLEEGERNEPAMKEMLNELNQKYCDSNCEVGAAGKEVGYLCPGTCIDYAYDKINASYSFAWEIYRRDMYEKEDPIFGFLQINNKNKVKKAAKNNNVLSCFIQSSSNTELSLDPESCFHNFNPGTREQYEQSVNNWSNAILELFIMVHDDINRNKNYL